MNLYIRTIGFQYLDADFEEEMIHARNTGQYRKRFCNKEY